jgi:hypothetical protein
MSLSRLTFAVSALALSAGFAQPAGAFGSVCIPTLPNCMCTFQVPCPVIDPQKLSTEIEKTLNLEKIEGMMGEIQIPGQQFLKALRGSTGNIPGLDSIGIDLGGLVNGDLSSLGLNAFPSALAGEISSLGIDAGMISELAGGNLSPSGFMDIADSFGVDMGMLENVGLDAGTIAAIAGGDISTMQMFSVAQNMGFEAGVLHDIGITSDLIQGVADGGISPDRIMQIAENSGLSMDALGSVGLDQSILDQLPSMSQPDVMSLLQQAGFDSSPLSGLGLDAGMIGRISSGELPATAINDLVAGTGIDPSAITIPSANGPISLAGTPGSTPTDQYSTISIPAKSIPGLDGILNGSSGSGTFTGAGSENAAMCATSRSLVSAGEPPNPFGDDVANIDMAISGGSVEAYPEAVADARWAVRKTSAFGMGRAIQVRPLIPRALAAIDSFEKMMQESQSLQDDVIINDTIHGQLMTAKAEKTSLLTAYASVRAAEKLTETALSPTPTLPNDSRFREIVAASPARQQDRQQAIAARTLSSTSSDYATIQHTSNEAILHYNLEQDARRLESGIPAVENTIDRHEIYKQFLVDLEPTIKAKLATLYTNPQNAWEVLRPQLYNNAGDYIDGGKWSRGAAAATRISQAVSAQTASTAYGQRRPNTSAYTYPSGGGENGTGGNVYRPPYSTISRSPSSYSAIDAHASSESDPYRARGSGLTSVAGSEGGGPPLGVGLVSVFEYYFETLRRMEWYARTRRGTEDRTMTGKFWLEMQTNAPTCLSGPLPSTESNLQQRPELFDLDKDCTHIVWTGADPGDYIPATYLGGADSALWLAKISLDQVDKRTGGPAKIREDLQDTLDLIQGGTTAASLEMQGYATSARHIDEIVRALRGAISDPNFASEVEFPMASGS